MNFFQSRDLLIRPIGQTVYLLPPYCSTAAELRRCHEALAEAGDAFG